MEKPLALDIQVIQRVIASD